MRNEKELNKMYEECRQIMISIGFNVPIIPITLNGRLSSTLGRYFRKSNRIEINKSHFLYGTEHNVKNTILHEMCHQICPVGGHGTQWKKIAQIVTMKTPYKIQTYANSEEYKTEDGENYIKRRKMEKKYGVRCDCCNKEWKYATKSKPFMNPHRYKCPYCKDFTLSSFTI